MKVKIKTIEFMLILLKSIYLMTVKCSQKYTCKDQRYNNCAVCENNQSANTVKRVSYFKKIKDKNDKK